MRRKINVSAASKLLFGGFMPSSGSEATVSSKKLESYKMIPSAFLLPIF